MMWSGADLRALDSIRIGPAEVVYAFVSLADETTDADLALLDRAERGRAGRFVRQVDRDRFILAHAALRSLLARTLDVEPSLVHYEEGPHGKPRLAQASGSLEFNLSHSEGLALVAVAHERPMGVDVEHLRQLPDLSNIAETTFSVAELQELRSMPAAEQMAGFFSCWTRKEAVVKATGDGIGYPLDSFDVSVLKGSTSALMSYAGRAGLDVGISLRDLATPVGYAAAAAALNPDRVPLQWRELALEP